MNVKNIFMKTAGTGALAISLLLAGSIAQPVKTEAINLGKIGGTVGTVVNTAAEQEKVRKSLDYYENEGRNELFDEIKKSDGVVTDQNLNTLLDRIMTKLSGAVAKTEPSITEKPYNYFINPQDSFNAYCTLGHNISINVGVFAFLDNSEDMVASVVAHELVHGQKNHPINGAKKKMTVDFVQKIAGSQMGGGGRLAVDVVAANTKAVGITKPNEWESDNVAFGYITEAGYNPGAPAAVWQRIIDSKTSGGSKNIFDDILNPSTHPSEKERRDNYAKKLTEYSGQIVTVDASTGQVKINNKPFMKPAAFGNMSGLERSYLIAGNLAAAYRSSENLTQARNDNGIIKLGGKDIVQPCSADTGADELVRILNEIK